MSGAIRHDDPSAQGRRIAALAGDDVPPPPRAADDDDALDRLGTRIGRTLGLILSLAMLAGLVIHLLGRAG